MEHGKQQTHILHSTTYSHDSIMPQIPHSPSPADLHMHLRNIHKHSIASATAGLLLDFMPVFKGSGLKALEGAVNLNNGTYYGGLFALVRASVDYGVFVLRGRPQCRYFVDDMAVNMITGSIMFSHIGLRPAILWTAAFGVATFFAAPPKQIYK